MQERKRQREGVGIGAFEAGAADHHVEPVLQHIGPDAVPQQLDRALVAIGRQHAGAAELQEFQAGVACDQGGDVEFAGAVEAAVPLRHVLTQQAVSADHRRLARRARRGVVDDEQMIAHRIERVDVAARQHRGRVRRRRHLAVEDLEAQPLRAPHVGRGPRETHLERAEAS